MRLVVAYIKPERLPAVKQSLFDAKVFKISIMSAMGCGEEPGYHEEYRGTGLEVDLLKRVRLEIAINEDYLQPTIDAITEGAKTGKVGDGKIFVYKLEECVRIRTGETGSNAIG
ncbi:MAG: P-II family nitrogen regulator [Deferribacteres bacterium]|nr:P-II family nitrogen regulator [candidate division KSB1 bacterium]MCB9500603.1 P-II family nitrogen regulator [Deferribacteres bacterium]